MPYTPAYNATFGKPLLNQIIAIIQRDQAAALSIVNASLAAISEFHKGPGLRMVFPWLTLAADSTVFDRESPQTRRSLTRVALALDVGQFDQEMAQDNAQDYARVLDMIVTTAPLSDFTAPLPIVHETVPGGTTVPPAAGSVTDVFVESHAYSLVTLQNVEIPALRMTLTALFEMEET